MDHLKDFLKLFKYATSSGIHMVVGRLDLLKSTYYHGGGRGRVFHEVHVGAFVMVILLLSINFKNINFL